MKDLIKEATEKIKTNPIFTEDSDPIEEEIERKRKELILLSANGDITKSVAYITKASGKVIEKMYAEYKAKCLEKDSEFMTDFLISQLAVFMGGLNMIEKPDEMEKDLQSNPILKKDLKTIVTWVAPLIPFFGLLSGGFTVGKHVE